MLPITMIDKCETTYVDHWLSIRSRFKLQSCLKKPNNFESNLKSHLHSMFQYV